MSNKTSSVSIDKPQLRIARSAHATIMQALCSRTPEAGGILLGPTGSNEVTDFHFDESGSCTRSTYSPDHISLQQLMNERWLPSGVDMKGFTHSHPHGFDWVSHGDMTYIQRLLKRNEDMDLFATPIVIPEQFRLRAIVVFRDNPTIPHAAQLVLF